MTPKRFMLIAGEASGDMLAAELVKELRAGMMRRFTYSPNVQPIEADLAPRFFGAGGPRMAEAGVELALDLTRHSLTGLPTPREYLKFRRILHQMVALACEREPHVIICVDFSVFNSAFAAAIAKYVRQRRGTFNNWKPKLIKYISPQVWASRANRAYDIARDFDLLLSIFPFEKDWYAARVPKLRVEFIGHPMIDRYASTKFGPQNAEQVYDKSRSIARSIVLLPGSRKGELDRHLPVMLWALKIIQVGIQNARALMILPTDDLLAYARAHPLAQGVEMRCGGLEEALASADLAISKTGTVTMECAYFRVPTVTLYKTSWITFQIGIRIVSIKSLTMPNLLAGEEVFPEFIQHFATPKNIARAALELLLDHRERRKKIKSQLAKIIASLGPPGASRRAADLILDVMTPTKSP